MSSGHIFSQVNLALALGVNRCGKQQTILDSSITCIYWMVR